jgi:hypothetical protein
MSAASCTNEKTDFMSVLTLVQQVLKSYHEIRDEIVRWRQILEVPYKEYLHAQGD